MHPLSVFYRSIALSIALFFGSLSIDLYSNPGARIIEFTSKLTDEKKGYKLLHVATFKPKKFKLTVNGHKIKDGQTVHIPVENNRFLIRYDYEFSAMLHTFSGYREVEFELIEPERTHYAIDFSWKDEHRFIIKHARYVQITQIYEPGSEHAR